MQWLIIRVSHLGWNCCLISKSSSKEKIWGRRVIDSPCCKHAGYIWNNNQPYSWDFKVCCLKDKPFPQRNKHKSRELPLHNPSVKIFQKLSIVLASYQRRYLLNFKYRSLHLKSLPPNDHSLEQSKMSDPKAEITTLLQTYAKHLNASDTSSIIPLYTKDGVLYVLHTPPLRSHHISTAHNASTKLTSPSSMAQNFPTASGHPSIRSAYEKTFSLITLSVTFNIHEIVPINDEYAFARTSSEGTVTVQANGGKSNEGNQELFMLKKEDGEWKIDRYCFCSVLPPH